MIHARRTRWPLAVLTVALAITLAFVSVVVHWPGRPGSTSAQPGPPDGESLSAPAKSITLLEAWNIAERVAKQWQADAVLTGISSSDLGDSPDKLSGTDGARRTWTAFATSETAEGGLFVRITDGVVAEQTEEDVPLSDPITAKPAIDSPQAVEIARTVAPELGSGGGKAAGIHFALESDPNSGGPVIRVVGTNSELGVFVELDALSGKPVASYQQDYANGAVLNSADAGVTWHPSDLADGAVRAVANDPISTSTTYAVAASTTGIEVYGSDDWGATWGRVGQLPVAAGTWPYDIEALVLPASKTPGLLVGTPSGLWLSTDRGTTWSQVAGLPAGPAWQVAAAGEESSPVVFVTVVPGPDEAVVYSSADLISWKEELQGAFRLSESLGGTSVLAIDETQPAEGTILGPGERDAVRLPATSNLPQDVVLRAAGRFGGTSPVVAESPSGIYVLDANGVTWRKTLDTSLASIALSPDFESSGIGLAGGFRTGIYRTSDGGRTWAHVVADPSAITPCSGEVSSILFLAKSNALAVCEPTLVWRQR